MTESVGPAGPQSIRIDSDAVRRASPEVQRAVDVLLAYLAGLDEGRRQGLAQRPAGERPVPPTRPAEVPGPEDAENAPAAAGGAEAAARLEAHAEAAGAASLFGGQGQGIVCGTVSYFRPDGGSGPVPAPPPTGATREVYLVWGPGAGGAVPGRSR